MVKISLKYKEYLICRVRNAKESARRFITLLQLNLFLQSYYTSRPKLKEQVSIFCRMRRTSDFVLVRHILATSVLKSAVSLSCFKGNIPSQIPASKRENASATSRISLLSEKVSRESNNLKRFAANNLIKNAANEDKNNEDKKRR